MLYIFHVDTGTTITFDIQLALQSVAQLKEAIERECGVVAAQQVLLMSGGESLEPSARVCSYSAGTDTNPIYLFSKAAIESHVPPTPNIHYSSDVDLHSQIENSLAMPATYQTVSNRAQLAQQCCGLARELTRICERLVHDQHLQQQGWAAVVANLEDITQVFQTKADFLQHTFAQYLIERRQHMELLQNFSSDLGTLEKIPILPALRAHAEGFLSPEEELEKSDTATSALSLLKWISAKDNQSSLEQVAEQCAKGLEQFDERVLQSLKDEVNAAIEGANNQNMKEIKGLGDRLSALEDLMTQARRVVQEQGELAQGFLQNQNRANNLGDASVLPDLCTSHRRQLMVMLKNHNQLRDIRKRCTKAKEELSTNINQRLKWIMYVENKIMEVDGKLVIYNESLRRLRRHMEVLQQIHLAPEMYLNAIAEVVRRRTFSKAFMVWASDLACQLMTVHSEELARRREFQNKFEGHFLNTLFPGMEDTPPPYATRAPSVFDNSLPKLTVDDMETLKQQLPDLALSISTPDLNSITQFFLSKSLSEVSSIEKDKDKTSMMATESKAKDRDDKRTLMSDRGTFGSETDTEEFEKICQEIVDSKLGSLEGAKQQQKQLEVGGSQNASPVSSTSTNLSSLDSKCTDPSRLSSSSEPSSFQCPSLSAFERQSQLSPLTECVESNVDVVSPVAQLLIPDPKQYQLQQPPPPPPLPPPPNPQLTYSVECDGRDRQRVNGLLSGSGGSSPSAGLVATADFVGTEYYMDESLPSSLSEHTTDRQHQAIVSFLQENLVDTRDEVERLRHVLYTLKNITCKTMMMLRKELMMLRENAGVEKRAFNETLERVRQVVALHAHALQKREQELAMEHELQLSQLKDAIMEKDKEIDSMKEIILEKDNQLTEHDRLVNAMHIKLENEKSEMRNLHLAKHRQLEEALHLARIDKEGAVKEANDANFAEISTLSESLEQCQERIRELEASLTTAKADQQRLVKEATVKLQIEYKTELETIRSRFKLMAASAMERSPSDSSLEKIERSDILEMINCGAMASQSKDEPKSAEEAMAIEKAIERERVKMTEKLQVIKQIIDDKCLEIEVQRAREKALMEECETHKMTIRRLTEWENTVRQNLNEKVEDLKAANSRLETKIEKCEHQVFGLEAERDELRQELNGERLKMSQDNLEDALESSKEDVAVSESKKVRLESDEEAVGIARRLELLEVENRRLNAELRSICENKGLMEVKLEDLEADKVRLELELLKERRRIYSLLNPSTSQDSSRSDKEMTASIAVMPPSEACSSPKGSREAAGKSSSCRSSPVIREHLSRSTANLVQNCPFTTTSCNRGDVVLVLWDEQHMNYILLQQSPTFYFLNSDSVEALDLQVTSVGTSKRIYAFAEVVDKEYCHARKQENRYRVPKGTKFYRVRVRPISLIPETTLLEKKESK